MSVTIAIDFDGVIHKYRDGYLDGTIYDVPIDGAFDAMKALMKKGFTVFILSTRDPRTIQDWLARFQVGVATQIIPETVIFWNTPNVIGITNRKLPAIAYIDDRGIRFTNWTDILNYF